MKSNPFNNVILLIVFNYSKDTIHTDFFKKMYGPFFKTIIFYSDTPANDANCLKKMYGPFFKTIIFYRDTPANDAKEVNYISIEKGHYTQRIFPHFYNKYKSLISECSGVFYTMDDNIINCNLLETVSPEKLIFHYRKPMPMDGSNSASNWLRASCGQNAINNIQSSGELEQFGPINFTHCWSDYFYLPKRYLTPELFTMFDICGKYYIFLEFAIPSIIFKVAQSEEEFNVSESLYLWDNRHFTKNIEWVSNIFKTHLTVHPFKLSSEPILKKWLLNILSMPPPNKKCIVITTINQPTQQLLTYTRQAGWDLIVVGDSKTPDDAFKDIGCIYLDLDKQKTLYPTLYSKIPLNSYARKMFGYLYAIQHKYGIIYDTDDDNKYTMCLDSYENNIIVKPDIDFPGYDINRHIIGEFSLAEINLHARDTQATCFTYDKRNGELWLKNNDLSLSQNARPHAHCISGFFRSQKVSKTPGFVNLYKNYTAAHIWPRGIPPAHTSINITPTLSHTPTEMPIAIIQGLVNNDPDVDAHYRINISDKPFTFEHDPGFDVVLDKYSVCPFNTQNTFWQDPATFYAMYLPVTVSFRYTDILRGFIALYQLWKNNKTIKFTYPTAIQDRNPHDLQKDYESELPMYRTAEQVIDLLNENKDATIQEVYTILYKNNIVSENELDTLNTWMEQVAIF